MKTLKGHATIELTDVKTGKKERIEHNNMVTNALTKLIGSYACSMGRNVDRIFLPLIEKGLGGIYLFDNTLTEDVNNIWLPNLATAKLTGYAGHATSDGADNKRGDYNLNESGAITNGYKFVWDFGTDDANGEIAALALTNAIAGYQGYDYSPLAAVEGLSTNTGNEVLNNYKGYDADRMQVNIISSERDAKDVRFVEYDETNRILTRIVDKSNTRIDIEKYSYSYSYIDLENTLYTIKLLETTSITVSDTLKSNTSPVWVDGADGYYYGIYAPNSNGVDLYIAKINKSTLAYTNTVHYTLPVGTDLRRIQYSGYYSNEPLVNVAIRNGYLYTLRKTNGQVVKIPLNNPTDTEYINGTEHTPHVEDYYDMYEFVYKDKNNNILTNAAILGNNDELATRVQINGVIPYSYNSGRTDRATPRIETIGDQMRVMAVASSYDSSNFYPNLQYLATINNLDAPVTKTATKTMKITYTLTYAEE